MSNWNFDKVKANIDRMKVELPVKIANHAMNHFVGNFKKQAFDGLPWKQVQRRIPGTYAYKYPAKPKSSSRTRPILIGQGTLRRAVGNSIRIARWDKIRLVVDLPYAKIHNDGGWAGKDESAKIPKRQYIGDNPTLQREQRQIINRFMKNIWV